MKILQFGNVPLPPDHPYRSVVRQHPGKWVLNWASAQRRSGLDVELCCLLHKAPKDFDLDVDGVPVHYLRTLHPYRHFTFYAFDQMRMAHLARKLHPDLVVGHGTENANGWAALRSGLPFCIVAQGSFTRILRRSSRQPSLDERFLRAGERYVWRRTRFAIAVSDYVREELTEDYPHLDITRIPLTYDPVLDMPVDYGAKRNASFAFVGTVDDNKGIPELSTALERLASGGTLPELHLVGNGPESAGGHAGGMLRRLRTILGPKLILHGRLRPEDVFAVLDRCQTIVAPSREEMFGNQLIEGLMRGCRAIVTDQTALAENGRRFGNTIVVPQSNPDALASAIAGTMARPIDSGESESARENIRNYMSPKSVAALSGNAFSSILEKQRM